MKRLADGLTALRFVLALPLIWVGLVVPADSSVVPAAWLTLVAWTSDWLDGPLARRARSRRQTWLGRHDLEADLGIVVGQAVVLGSWGIVLVPLVTVAAGAGWAIWCVARRQNPLALLFGGLWTERKKLVVHTAPLQFVIFVVYGSFLVMVWSLHAPMGRVMGAWLLATLALSPRRSWHRVRSYFVVTRRFLARKGMPMSTGVDADPAAAKKLE